MCFNTSTCDQHNKSASGKYVSIAYSTGYCTQMFTVTGSAIAPYSGGHGGGGGVEGGVVGWVLISM